MVDPLEEYHRNKVRKATREAYYKPNYCQKCGKEGKTDFHHLNFENTNPTNWIVLCSKCQKKAARFPDRKNAYDKPEVPVVIEDLEVPQETEVSNDGITPETEP